MNEAEVLIVGAGPTGLVLALWLTRLKVKVRIVDKAEGPGQTSRALAVHARTLEFYDQVGLAEPLLAQARKLEAARLWVKGRQRTRLMFGDMGVGLSPFPYSVIYPQDEHERLLVARLESEGVTVERGVELVGCETCEDGLTATLRLPGGTERRVEAAFLAGCDGARSKVRELVGGAFPGGTYSRLFYVADIEAGGPVMNAELNLALDEGDFLAIFPMKGTGRARLVGDIERPDSDALSFADVGHQVIDRLGVQIRKINWFSTYRVHHRVTDRWRAGRMFLLGDAAHIHSPVGGQGMNTGIGDAINLAWKLATVLKGDAAADLLDTYEPERIAFAHRLVASTDRAFQVITSDGPLARFARQNLAPVALAMAFKFAAMRRLMFLTISQTAINYRGGALAEGEAGGIAGGDRLPWVREADNFAPLESVQWRGQVFGEASEILSTACAQAQLPLDRFAWTRSAERAGFARGVFHLVRPDGHVALIAQEAQAPAALAAFQARHGLKF